MIKSLFYTQKFNEINFGLCLYQQRQNNVVAIIKMIRK